MLQSRDRELLLVHAALQVQYQKPEQAITLLNALLEVDPEHQEARQVLAVACLNSGQLTRAIELCESLLKTRNSNQSGLWFCLSQARWKQNDAEGARQCEARVKICLRDANQCILGECLQLGPAHIRALPQEVSGNTDRYGVRNLRQPALADRPRHHPVQHADARRGGHHRTLPRRVHLGGPLDRRPQRPEAEPLG